MKHYMSNAKLFVMANGVNLIDENDPNKRYAYINSSAEYEPLLIYHESPKNGTFDILYSLLITYTPRSKAFSKNVQRKELAKRLKCGEKWDIVNELKNEPAYWGGNVTLTCSYKGAKEVEIFYIRGRFLEKGRTDAYIKGVTNDPAIEWMPIGIARHETGICEYAQFNKRGVFEQGDADIMHTPNEADNGDGGLGLFQLTNGVTITNMQFWNWKENSKEGIKKLKRCVTEADEWMNAPVGFIGIQGKFPLGGQRVQAKMENNGIKQLVPVQTVEGIVFQDSTNRPIEHAVALKIYNGASEGHYCVWVNKSGTKKGFWKFNVVNNLNSNYVQKVCSAYVAGGGK